MIKNFSYEYLGDRALIISVKQGGINNIHEIYSILSKKLEDLVLDFVKTPESLALYNDPYKVSVKDLSKRVKSLLESETLGKKERIAKTWKIPVCYDGSFGLDIKHVSKKTNLSPNFLWSSSKIKSFLSIVPRTISLINFLNLCFGNSKSSSSL